MKTYLTININNLNQEQSDNTFGFICHEPRDFSIDNKIKCFVKSK